MRDAHVEVREQLCRINSLSTLTSRDQTQVARLAKQVPLPTKLFDWPCFLI